MEDYLILVTYWNGRDTGYDTICVTATSDRAALRLARSIVKSRSDIIAEAFHLDIAEIGGEIYHGPLRAEDCW